MRFNVEKTFLKDEIGTNPSVEADLGMVLLRTEAENVGDAVSNVLQREHAELVDEVRWLPGSQAVAAIKKDHRLFMLQFSPEDEEDDREMYVESPRPSISSFDDTHRSEQRR